MGWGDEVSSSFELADDVSEKKAFSGKSFFYCWYSWPKKPSNFPHFWLCISERFCCKVAFEFATFYLNGTCSFRYVIVKTSSTSCKFFNLVSWQLLAMCRVFERITFAFKFLINTMRSSWNTAQLERSKYNAAGKLSNNECTARWKGNVCAHGGIGVAGCCIVVIRVLVKIMCLNTLQVMLVAARLILFGDTAVKMCVIAGVLNF